MLEPDPADYADRTFCRLDLIDIGKSQVRIAVRDYIRAFTQRSRWSDENLLRPGEIRQYERRLTEEWEGYAVARRKATCGPTLIRRPAPGGSSR